MKHWLQRVLEWWKARPGRKRDWQIIAAFGGSNYRLKKVAEKDLPKLLAPPLRILYIDSYFGIVFIDDGSRPNTEVSS